MKISSYPLSTFPISAQGAKTATGTTWESEGGAVASGASRLLITSRWRSAGGAVCSGTNKAAALKVWQTAGGFVAGGFNYIAEFRQGLRYYEAVTATPPLFAVKMISRRIRRFRIFEQLPRG